MSRLHAGSAGCLRCWPWWPRTPPRRPAHAPRPSSRQVSASARRCSLPMGAESSRLPARRTGGVRRLRRDAQRRAAGGRASSDAALLRPGRECEVDLTANHPQESPAQQSRGCKGNSAGSPDSRQMPPKWLNPGSRDTHLFSSIYAAQKRFATVCIDLICWAICRCSGRAASVRCDALSLC